MLAESPPHSRSRFGRTGQLLRFARPYWGVWAVVVTLSLITMMISLAQPWPMKVLIDNVLGNHEPGRVLRLLPGASRKGALASWVALAGVLLFALNVVSEVVYTRAWIRAGQRTVYDLAAELFSRILGRSLPFHARHPVGDSLSRVTGDCWCVYGLVEAAVIAPVRAAVMAAAVVAVMLPMDWQLTVGSLAAAPILALTTIWFGKRVRASARAAREVEAEVRTHVHQTLTGVAVVQAFAQEEREDERFTEFARRSMRAKRKGVLFGSLTDFGNGAVTTIGTAVILFIGAHRVLNGSLSIGAMLVFVAYLGALQRQMTSLVNAYNTVQNAGGQIDRVLEILESVPEVPEPIRPVRLHALMPEIRFEAVSFGYETGRPVLRDVTLRAPPGQTTAIVGATGAGKSTLVSLVPRFMDPCQGRLTIDGIDLRNVALRDLRQQVSVVMQEPFLFPVSIAENIAFGQPGASRQQIIAAAQAANAHEFISRLADGYETIIGERGATLSGGERQRLSIARALLKDAAVLILDEPTSAVDAETEAQLLDALERLMVGRTTFIIAHRLTTIQRADQILVLERGRVRECGSHDELIRSGGAYAEMNKIYHGSGQRSVAIAG